MRKMQEETGYVEAYHNLHVYTKEGKRCGYICDICDIRYENPRDLYRSTRTCNILCKKEKDKMQVISDPKKSDVQRYIARLYETPGCSESVPESE